MTKALADALRKIAKHKFDEESPSYNALVVAIATFRSEAKEALAAYYARQSSDLVRELRNPCGIGAPSDHQQMEQAADRIEKLEAAQSLEVTDAMAERAVKI